MGRLRLIPPVYGCTMRSTDHFADRSSALSLYTDQDFGGSAFGAGIYLHILIDGYAIAMVVRSVANVYTALGKG